MCIRSERHRSSVLRRRFPCRTFLHYFRLGPVGWLAMFPAVGLHDITYLHTEDAPYWNTGSFFGFAKHLINCVEIPSYKLDLG
jgi:hypothetical protein